MSVQAAVDGMEEDRKENVLPPLPSSVFIGDIGLQALRKELTNRGIKATFAGEGLLLCEPIAVKQKKIADPKNRVASSKPKSESTPDVEVLDVSGGQVLVRKPKSGQLMIEGSSGETFTAVRSAIYSLHVGES